MILEVGPGVLIPRPETELLAGFVIDAAPVGAAVCDLCTGPGTIALAVATERPDLQVTAADISATALAYAERNRTRCGAERVRLVRSDLFAALEGERFAVITANPPYVTAAEYRGLDREVRDFEPELALSGGGDGLDLVRKLVAAAPEHLVSGGRIYLELGLEQGPAVLTMLAAAGFTDGRSIRDLTGRERFVSALIN